MAKKRLLLIDGTSYIYRAFHAIPYLSNSKGLPTNAVYGFAQILLKTLKNFKSEHIVVAFDVKGPSFRHKMYEEYKAHRVSTDKSMLALGLPAVKSREMPENLKLQIPYIKELVMAFNIPAVELEGYEADDIIGTISRHMKESDVEVIIIAADKDMLQLIDANTTIVDATKDRRLGLKEIRECYGIDPEQITDMIGLAGDPSDNIPGVRGIGEKTAIKLIRKFGSIENLLQNVDGVAEKGVREKLLVQAEEARLSKRLATIDKNVPVDYKFGNFVATEPDYRRLKELLKELEFTKLMKDIIPAESSPTGDYSTITKIEHLRTFIDEIKKTDEMAIVIKTDIPVSGNVFGLAFCVKPRQAVYIPTGHRSPGCQNQLDIPSVAGAFAVVLEDENVRKISHDMKGAHIFFKQHNIQVRGVCVDTSIASYILNPSRQGHEIADIAHEQIDYAITPHKAVSFADLDTDLACSYACSEADAVFQLAGKFVLQVEGAGLLQLFNNIEVPLTEVLAEMELCGIKVDKSYLLNFSKELEGQIDSIRKRIYGIAGGEFNVNSPRQLSDVLFERLRLKPVKRTKTGFSTDEEVLRILSAQHELPAEVLNFRQFSKLKSTYADALLGLVNPATGRVHTSFNQTVTATGRLSSSGPNLQNIPIRTETGRRIRQAFIADKERILLSADYSQIELRIVAHLSQDHLLLEAFRRDEDIHNKTASEVFGTPPEEVTPEERRRAKAINFGIIYGMGPYGLAAELGISQDEARGHIDNYFTHYHGVKAFIDSTINEAVEKGYVTTLFGRRRYIPEVMSKSEQIRRLGERLAINTPIQGAAADLIKIAMINIFCKLKKDNLRSKMLLQIHDELIFEAPLAEIELLKGLVKEEMENAAVLTVPVKVDVSIGKNWGEL